MTESVHARLPLEELAVARRVLHGRIDAAVLASRLGKALGRSQPEGELDYELAFAPTPEGAVALSGLLRARLVATCQRCLQPFELALEVPVRLLVPGAAGDAAEAGGWEVAAPGVRPTLAEVIEEELLLALPFLPSHPAGQCVLAPSGAEHAGEARQRPFAGLDEAWRRDRD